jgi:hypothetical protein
MENKVNDEEPKYPSVGLAYEFVKPSYDWMLNRLQAIDSKIQGLLTFATAITAAIPVFAKAIHVNFSSAWFYAAIITYVLFAVLGIVGLRFGKVRLINPEILYNRWVNKTIWQFQKDGIYFAGKDFKDNKNLIERKSLFRDFMAILFVGEVLCVIVWVIMASGSIQV